MNIVKRNYNLQNPNMCSRFLHYNHIRKKALQTFCATNKYDSDSKKMMFLIKMDDYQNKMCDTLK
jgi:hypothetical protein